MSLERFLASRYRLCDVRLRPLTGGMSEHTYLVEHTGTPRLVLRIAGGDTDALVTDPSALLFLAARGYPAPQVILSQNGDAATEYNGQTVLLTTFIEGTPVDHSPEDLWRMGEMVGRLHALDVSDVALPAAQMLPIRDVAWVSKRLAAIEERVTADRRERYDELLAMVAAIPSFDSLPCVLIHNDCHPGNAVLAPAGQVILIDWDGAGLGPAIIDLGFLLTSSDQVAPWTAPLPADPARVNAVVDGYSRHRIPDDAELAPLADAIRFRTVIFAAATFAYEMEQGKRLPNSDWWEARYAASDELAERAWRRFDANR